MKVEFKGGPLDGAKQEFKRPMPIHRIPHFGPLPTIVELLQEGKDYPEVTISSYELMSFVSPETNRRWCEYHWKGAE